MDRFMAYVSLCFHNYVLFVVGLFCFVGIREIFSCVFCETAVDADLCVLERTFL